MTDNPDRHALKDGKPTACIGLAGRAIRLVLKILFGPNVRNRYALKNWKATAYIGLAVGVILLGLNIVFGPSVRKIGVLEGAASIAGWIAAALFVNAMCFGDRP